MKLLSGTFTWGWTMLRTFLAVCFLTICSGSSLARSTGALSGQVSDPTGAVVPRASVSATPTSGQAATVVTNGRGAYEFKQLAPGQYTITAKAAGFAVSQQQFAISAGRVHRLDISLTVEAQNGAHMIVCACCAQVMHPRVEVNGDTVKVRLSKNDPMRIVDINASSARVN